MALTMTRTRTQTTLTMLSWRVACAHGELDYVEGRLAGELPEELRQGLVRRREELLFDRDALYVALRQFDAALDPTVIGVTDEWLEPFGWGMAARRRYDAAIAAAPGSRGSCASI